VSALVLEDGGVHQGVVLHHEPHLVAEPQRDDDGVVVAVDQRYRRARALEPALVRRHAPGAYTRPLLSST